MNKIGKAFLKVNADDALKERTFEKVTAEMQKQRTKTENNEKKRSSAGGKIRYAKRLTAVAAVLIVALVFAGGGYQAYAKPVSYITIDVNPSLEIGINRWDKVVECTGLNSDGKDLLERTDIKGMDYRSAMEELIGDGQIQKCISQGDDFVLSVVSDDNDMQSEVETICNGHGMRYQCNRADESDREEAGKCNMSTGEYCMKGKGGSDADDDDSGSGSGHHGQNQGSGSGNQGVDASEDGSGQHNGQDAGSGHGYKYGR